MTQLLQIDPSWRLDAVRQQIARVRRQRLAVEVPEGWDELASPARMRLVQRQAQIQKCQLAIVTRDAATTQAARTVGLPVFVEAADAARRAWNTESLLPPVNLRNPAAGLPEPPAWRDPKRHARVMAQVLLPTQYQARQRRIGIETKARRHNTPAWLTWASYGALAGLFLVMLALFGLYVLPAATVTVRPGTERISALTRLTANPDLEESNLATAQIKGRLVETILEENAVAVTSGAIQKPTVKATGQAVFSNLGMAPVRVPLGTMVSTSTGTPIAFRTVTEVEIPGGVGQRATVGVEALEPGIQGNVRANTITNIDGPLRFRVRVSNPGGTGGGGSELVRAVTQEDKDRLLEETMVRAEARAADQLRAELRPGEWLPDESVTTSIIAQAFDQYNDDEADEVTLTLRLLVRGIAVDETEARNVLQAAVQSQIPKNGKLVAPSLVAQRIPGAAAVGRGVEFTMTVLADYVVPVEANEVRQAVAGKREETAAQALQARWRLAAPPEFYRDPQWLGTLPALPSRIQVRVVYDEPVATP
jgi:hypothetical protein